ncbi:hypothetical protein ABZ470_31700 [Streptosporangium sp. NPDC020072]|uniref:hypothetical protein n=1 Tax=Streptosporangium sp. NPDC020072 TaxID=3154788 RepID=UPI00341E2043
MPSGLDHLDIEAIRGIATHGPVTAQLLERSAARITQTAVRTAPATRPEYRNKYRSNISTELQHDRVTGWTAYVLAERHAMVIEFGWTEWRDEIKHPGKYVLTRALNAHKED